MHCLIHYLNCYYIYLISAMCSIFCWIYYRVVVKINLYQCQCQCQINDFIIVNNRSNWPPSTRPLCPCDRHTRNNIIPIIVHSDQGILQYCILTPSDKPCGVNHEVVDLTKLIYNNMKN